MSCPARSRSPCSACWLAPDSTPLDTEDEVERDEDDYDTNYIVAEYYPEEAHEALRQDYYWGGSDVDVLGVWLKDGIAKIYHAHMEGFWILGEDPVDFLQKIVAEDLELA